MLKFCVVLVLGHVLAYVHVLRHTFSGVFLLLRLLVLTRAVNQRVTAHLERKSILSACLRLYLQYVSADYPASFTPSQRFMLSIEHVHIELFQGLGCSSASRLHMRAAPGLGFVQAQQQ